MRVFHSQKIAEVIAAAAEGMNEFAGKNPGLGPELEERICREIKSRRLLPPAIIEKELQVSQPQETLNQPKKPVNLV